MTWPAQWPETGSHARREYLPHSAAARLKVHSPLPLVVLIIPLLTSLESALSTKLARLSFVLSHHQRQFNLYRLISIRFLEVPCPSVSAVAIAIFWFVSVYNMPL